MTNMLISEALPIRRAKSNFILNFIKSVLIKHRESQARRKAVEYLESLPADVLEEYGIERAGIAETRKRLTDFCPQMLAMRLYNCDSHCNATINKY